jgi:hypothetical protein
MTAIMTADMTADMTGAIQGLFVVSVPYAGCPPQGQRTALGHKELPGDGEISYVYMYVYVYVCIYLYSHGSSSTMYV